MAFFPLGDKNPRVLVQRPWITWGIMLSCVGFFLWEMSLGADKVSAEILDYAIVPAYITGTYVPPLELAVPPWAGLFTSLFLHVDLGHLALNMLFLLVFGDNIEDATGHLKFVVFYLGCGLAAGLVHVWVDPGSLSPTLGASGAISGILGGYLLLHPSARVWFFPFPVALPAWFWLICWAGLQFYAAYASGWTAHGVAWGAHIGGFLAGLLLIIPLRRKTVPLFGPREVPQGLSFADRKRDDMKD